MKRSEEKKRPRLWTVMALISALILGLTLGAIILSFRTLLMAYYEHGLRSQLSDAMVLLEESHFSSGAAQRVRQMEIRMLVMREEDGSVILMDLNDEPLKPEPGLPPEADSMPEHNLNQLSAVVQEKLGGADGSFFAADSEDGSASVKMESRRLYLWGRSQGNLFCLFLPMESAASAVNLAVRFTTQLGIAGWLLSLVVLYFASSHLSRPHKEISRTARKIANLDFSQRCKPARTRELNELSDSINRMSDRLQASVEDMRRTNALLAAELNERIRQQALTADLIANLSHDLKTPVAVISGYAEGLAEGVARTPEQRQTYYAMIQKESEHMTAIISRMLALTRVESGEIPLEIEEFDLAALLDDVISTFRGEIDRAGLELTTCFARPTMVRTDYESIRQSVINYVQNAVFHINGGTKIWIWTEPAEVGVRLCVANSSAPIPDREAARLWDKLYRGDNARQRSRGEAGLGLCIVRGNMKRLGLPYGLYNDAAFGGVVFWLELPAAEAEAEDAGAKDAPGTLQAPAEEAPAEQTAEAAAAED